MAPVSLVVVTGASGHVGAALVRSLRDRGHSVRALVRSDVRALEGLDVELRKVDVTDREGVRDAIAGASTVFHAAARLTLEAVHDPLADEVNFRGTENVVRACEVGGVARLVHFELGPRAPQGRLAARRRRGKADERSKALAERAVAAAERGLGAVIVSPAGRDRPVRSQAVVHGPGPADARARVPARHGERGQSRVDARDVALAAISAAERGAAGARYVVAGHWLAMPAFARIAARAAGVRPPPFVFPTGLARATAPLAERAMRLLGQEPLVTAASMDALEDVLRPDDGVAARELGHVPRPLEHTLGDTFRWFEDRGQLPKRSRRCTQS